ncbi:hypothetical protein DFQ27_009599 [Actinomortierella ambigua]|uniref:DUF1688 family protein n=1 Tax=Actinomortierella ambigua TaxID=1343610 RepID=A0A9P6QM84_9FUNG|nr:hypothetical protein DFQ26_007572 [Actinomortierella ambigua]KAG0270221.1 hypothetical protein DFQ27_009599 [Actinomortierella ambigua]
MAPSPTSAEAIAYLRSLPAVRERSERVFQKAQEGKLNHFDVDFTKLQDIPTIVVALIRRDHGDAHSIAKIPPHSRWRHFEVGGQARLSNLHTIWSSSGADKLEQARRTLDLMVISVLLDAGAGTKWTYKDKKAAGRTFRRSEGLAIASLDMFVEGAFSSEAGSPCQVDAKGLANLTHDRLLQGFQVNEETNPLVGTKGRWELLTRLGKALELHPEFFPSVGGKPARPGNMVDYLMRKGNRRGNTTVISVEELWKVVIDGFQEVWPPSRTMLNGVPMGDVWPCECLEKPDAPSDSTDHYVAFHKLSQWMTYSLMEPLEKLLDFQFENVTLLTGLPEYRNGGLLIDTGFMTLKHADLERGLAAYKSNALKPGQPAVEVVPTFEAHDPVIIEWRAMTVATLDRVATEVRKMLGLPNMTLAQVLQGGTWEAGREMAEVSRPNTRGPPIATISDGTLF